MSTGSALPHQHTALQQQRADAEKNEGDAKTVRDPGQSDVTKMKMEPDGSFNRKPSTFRNWISRDGEFQPEKGW